MRPHPSDWPSTFPTEARCTRAFPTRRSRIPPMARPSCTPRAVRKARSFTCAGSANTRSRRSQVPSGGRRSSRRMGSGSALSLPTKFARSRSRSVRQPPLPPSTVRPVVRPGPTTTRSSSSREAPSRRCGECPLTATRRPCLSPMPTSRIPAHCQADALCSSRWTTRQRNGPPRSSSSRRSRSRPARSRRSSTAAPIPDGQARVTSSTCATTR